MRRLAVGLLALGSVSCQLISVGEGRQASDDNQTNRQVIAGVVRSHAKEIEACYLQAIEARPGAAGRVLMSWDVAPDGKVTDATVKEAAPKITVIGDCLVGQVKSWTFPRISADDASVTVNYPFYFSENGQFTKD